MFATFCLVGTVGFVVDAGVLTLLVNGLGWHHYAGRAVSFPFAVTATWLLNRRWTFRRTGDTRTEYSRYFSVQAVGALINLATYAAIIEAVPRLGAVPVIPLAAGAALALAFNFLASRRFVFASAES